MLIITSHDPGWYKGMRRFFTWEISWLVKSIMHPCMPYRRSSTSSHASQVSAPRTVARFRGPHPRRHTNAHGRRGNVSCSPDRIYAIGNVHSGFGQADGRHHPMTAVALHTLPCELANVGSAGAIGTGQAAGQRCLTLVVVRARFWE